MRWVQRLNEETGEYEFIPVDASARALESSAAIHGPIDPYVSPIDGSVITGRTSLREHCKKHDVVLMEEYGAQGWEEAAKKRSDHFNGVTSREEKQLRREQINEIINHKEATRR
jgi:hypothetical protein